MIKTNSEQDCKNVFKPVPHLADGAIKFMDLYLEDHMNVFEWGAGGSTIWLADRVKHIYTVESKLHWIKFLSEEAEKRNLHNISFYYQATKDIMSEKEYCTKPDNYYSYIEDLKMKFDLILIDGETNSRNECAKRCIPHLSEKGVIIFDNYASFRFAESREHFMKWTTWNYMRKDGNTTAVIFRIGERTDLVL